MAFLVQTAIPAGVVFVVEALVVVNLALPFHFAKRRGVVPVRGEP
jgi:hypothetical protein